MHKTWSSSQTFISARIYVVHWIFRQYSVYQQNPRVFLFERSLSLFQCFYKYCGVFLKWNLEFIPIYPRGNICNIKLQMSENWSYTPKWALDKLIFQSEVLVRSFIIIPVWNSYYPWQRFISLDSTKYLNEVLPQPKNYKKFTWTSFDISMKNCTL